MEKLAKTGRFEIDDSAITIEEAEKEMRWWKQGDAGPRAKECGRPLETEEDEKTGPPQEPPRNTALPVPCRLQTSRTPRV